jgi:hypothetical protein
VRREESGAVVASPAASRRLTCGTVNGISLVDDKVYLTPSSRQPYDVGMSPYRRHTPLEAETALRRLAVALQVYRSETERLAIELGEAVRVCIEAGATWGEVGRQIGITKQAARAHWAPYCE